MFLKVEKKDIEVSIHTEVYSVEEAANLDKWVFIVAGAAIDSILTHVILLSILV